MNDGQVQRIWMLLQIIRECAANPDYANIAKQARDELAKVNEPLKPKAVPSSPTAAPPPVIDRPVTTGDKP